MEGDMMGKQLIMLSSVTYAMKAKKYLEMQGRRAYIERTPRELSSCGCGYSIRVDSDAEEISQQLSSIGIRVLGCVEV
jgi:hypothetical protein